MIADGGLAEPLVANAGCCARGQGLLLVSVRGNDGRVLLEREPARPHILAVEVSNVANRAPAREFKDWALAVPTSHRADAAEELPRNVHAGCVVELERPSHPLDVLLGESVLWCMRGHDAFEQRVLGVKPRALSVWPEVEVVEDGQLRDRFPSFAAFAPLRRTLEGIPLCMEPSKERDHEVRLPHHVMQAADVGRRPVYKSDKDVKVKRQRLPREARGLMALVCRKDRPRAIVPLTYNFTKAKRPYYDVVGHLENVEIHTLSQVGLDHRDEGSAKGVRGFSHHLVVHPQVGDELHFPIHFNRRDLLQNLFRMQS